MYSMAAGAVPQWGIRIAPLPHTFMRGPSHNECERTICTTDY